MSIPKTPEGSRPDLKQFQEHPHPVLPREWASTINLMAHPMAGASAMGAMGFAMAGHMISVWSGAMLGMAEASQRIWSGKGRTENDKQTGTQRPQRAKLELVASIPEPEAAEAAMRTATADVERAAQDVAEVTQKVARGVVDDAADAIEPLRKAAQAVSKTSAVEKPAGDAKAPARPKGIKKPSKPDDLKAISGIGPKLEQMLNGYGIWTYGQIAELSQAEIAWLDEELGFAGRIGRDDWLVQAKRLTGDKAKR